MTTGAGAGDALFCAPLPEGFSRHIFRFATGLDFVLEQGRLLDAMVLVEEGELEVECRAGARRRFGRGSMIPIGRLPVSHLRSAGPGPLVLIAVSRAPLRPTDEFRRNGGSYFD
jgi:hypothetical protein